MKLIRTKIDFAIQVHYHNLVLQIHAIQTSLYQGDEELAAFLYRHARHELQENCVLAISSKIVSIAEGQLVDRKTVSKDELIRRSADKYLGELNHQCHLTMKHNTLMLSAGIDESNVPGDYYLLLPENPQQSAKALTLQLRKMSGIASLAVILTDSRSVPFRYGVTGTALAFWGLTPVINLSGQSDLFGRRIKHTHTNIVESIAAAAVLEMGEAADRKPLACVYSDRVVFDDTSEQSACYTSAENDIFAPVYQSLMHGNRGHTSAPSNDSL